MTRVVALGEVDEMVRAPAPLERELSTPSHHLGDLPPGEGMS
ncbi:hypothetical protein ACFFQW_44450 [Umezawaea endophytica]|uniref:Uncharacterized protein n=1 Tax=Umezawaea endophytica TaxID=1654476 RepID=A0A9X3A6H5_9PSEU|nr:hypothetical protein [Umezawaea endophytica]MCS7484859.1 hypothetical protein [Umezawaea endophytica]